MQPLDTTLPIETRLEEAIIAALRDTGAFKHVGSMGRGSPPTPLVYPAAFAYFHGDTIVQERPRPVSGANFDVMIFNRNVAGETAAARDTYQLLAVARTAIEGTRFNIEGISHLSCQARSLVGWRKGVISYLLRFTTKLYYPVPGM